MKSSYKEFKEFISQGNVLDLAVGVLIGGAFKDIVSSLTKNLISPFIGLFLGKIDFSSIRWGQFKIGNFINDVISFFILALVVFFIVKGFNMLRRNKGEDDVDVSTPEQQQVDVLEEIRDLLKKEN